MLIVISHLKTPTALAACQNRYRVGGVILIAVSVLKMSSIVVMAGHSYS